MVCDSSALLYVALAGRCSVSVTLVPPGGGEKPAANIATVRAPEGDVMYPPIDEPPVSLISREVVGPMVTILNVGSDEIGVVNAGSWRVRQTGSTESIRIACGT